MAIVFKTPKSTLNTTTRDIQNVDQNCQPCPEPVLEAADLEYTQNGEYTVTPEEGVDGFSSIDVTVNVPSDVNNQNKTVNPSTSSQTVEADSGYSGLGTVTVSAVTSSIDNNISAGNIKKDVTILGVTGNYDPQPNLQSKSATPSTSAQTIQPDNGYDGLSSVSVAAVTAAIDQNIQSQNILSGVTILGVAGSDAGYDAGYSAGETAGEEAGYQTGYDEGYAAGQEACPSLDLGAVDETITQNGTYAYDPADYGETPVDGFSMVDIVVNVQPTLQNKTVTPTTSSQSVSADSPNYGLGTVTVNAVTSSIDANIQPENILSGVTILGVSGTDEGYNAGYSAGETAGEESGYAAGYDVGYAAGQADCPAPDLGTLSVTPSTSAQTLTPSEGDGWNEVDVAAVTSAIDQNIAAGNIKNGVTILGVTGSYSGASINNQNKTVSPSTSQQSISADQGYTGLGTVTVNAVTAAIDANIQAANILDGVTILGVTGTDAGYDAGYADGYDQGLSECGDPQMEFSSDTLSLKTNQEQQFAISSPSGWEITPINPNTRGAVRSGGLPLEFSQTQGSAGVTIVTVKSESDQEGAFEISNENGESYTMDFSSVGDYFKIESLEDDNVITWSSYDDQHILEYSLDDGETWVSTVLVGPDYNMYNCELPAIDTGETILFRGNNERFGYDTNSESCRFSATKTINVSGYLCSIANANNYTNYELSAPYMFKSLFSNCTIVDASELILPNNVSRFCYFHMFQNNFNLIAAPVLPATTLANGCYDSMFETCSSLQTAPELPATMLADGCYKSMFGHCYALVNPPALPAIYLEDLVSVYNSMFRACVALTTAPVLPALKPGIACYREMFKECASLEEVTCLATDISATTCTGDWLDGVAASGTFYKNANMSSWTTGTSGIPSGWTVSNAS